MDEAIAEIDDLDDGTPAPGDEKGGTKRTPKGKTTPTPPKPEDKKGQEGQPAAGAPPEDKTPSNIKDLRKGYEDQKKRIREEFEPTIARLNKELKEIREAPQFTQTKEQKEKIAAIEARNKELEEHIRRVDYKKSQEYLDKYEKPYAAAWQKARRDLAEVEVTMANGTTRKATDEDIMQLASMPLGAARRKASEMFGDSADDIMFHVRRISELSDQQDEALANFMKEAETQTQTKEQEAKTAAQNRVQFWNSANEELSKKYPDWFAPADGDTNGNSLLDKGLALADLHFAIGTIDAKRFELLPKFIRDDLIANKGKLSEQGAAKLHALMRNKIANHDRAILRINRLTKKLAAAEKALKEFEDSAPGGRPASPGGHESTEGFLEDANAELDKLDNPRLG